MLSGEIQVAAWCMSTCWTVTHTCIHTPVHACKITYLDYRRRPVGTGDEGRSRSRSRSGGSSHHGLRLCGRQPDVLQVGLDGGGSGTETHSCDQMRSRIAPRGPDGLLDLRKGDGRPKPCLSRLISSNRPAVACYPYCVFCHTYPYFYLS